MILAVLLFSFAAQAELISQPDATRLTNRAVADGPGEIEKFCDANPLAITFLDESKDFNWKGSRVLIVVQPQPVSVKNGAFKWSRQQTGQSAYFLQVYSARKDKEGKMQSSTARCALPRDAKVKSLAYRDGAVELRLLTADAKEIVLQNKQPRNWPHEAQGLFRPVSDQQLWYLLARYSTKPIRVGDYLQINHAKDVRAMALTADGKQVALLDGRNLALHNTDDGALVRSIDITNDNIGAWALALHPTDQTLALGVGDGSVRTYKLPELRLIKEVKPRGAGVTGIAWVPQANATKLACGHNGGQISFCDMKTGEIKQWWRLKMERLLSGDLKSVACSRDGRHVAVISRGRAWLWDTQAPDSVPVAIGEADKQKPPVALAFSAKGNHIYVGYHDGRIEVFDVPTRESRRVVKAVGEGHGFTVRELKTIHKGKYLLTNVSQGYVLYDTKTFEPVKQVLNLYSLDHLDYSERTDQIVMSFYNVVRIGKLGLERTGN